MNRISTNSLGCCSSGWESSLQLADNLFANQPLRRVRPLTDSQKAVVVANLGPRMCLSTAEFEKKLKTDLVLQQKAMDALNSVFSPESLLCLLQLFSWMDHPSQTLEQDIIQDFIQFSSPNEICLCSTLRESILENFAHNKSNTKNFMDVKEYLLTDLRFHKQLNGIVYFEKL